MVLPSSSCGGTDSCCAPAVAQAGSAHAAAGCRVAATAAAFARELAACLPVADPHAVPPPQPLATHATMASIVLLPVLQHSARPGASHLALLPQLELIKLQMQRLAIAPDAVMPLLAPGAAAPGPPCNALTQDAVSWYMLQQSLLCALQVRSMSCTLRHLSCHVCTLSSILYRVQTRSPDTCACPTPRLRTGTRKSLAQCKHEERMR